MAPLLCSYPQRVLSWEVILEVWVCPISNPGLTLLEPLLKHQACPEHSQFLPTL